MMGRIQRLTRGSNLSGALRSRRLAHGSPAPAQQSLSAETLTQLSDALAQSLQVQQFLTQRDCAWLPQQLGAWPVDAKTLARLVLEISSGRYQAALEFGSGASTVAMAKALALKWGHGGAIRHLAFEHLPDFHAHTQSALVAMGLAQLVQLELAPIVDVGTSLGAMPFGPQRFYDCDESIKTFTSGLDAKSGQLLVLIDGPPGSTCAKARYPALPAVLKHTAHLDVFFVLDDSNRPDEIAALKAWRDYMQDLQIKHHVENWSSPKGVAVITVPAH